MATGIPPQNGIKKNRFPVFLSYDGKKTEEDILNQNCSNYKNCFTINGSIDSDNLLFYGDNQDVLLYLINSGYAKKIKLIYIDPPFATTSNFVNREMKIAYSDSLSGAEYVEFLRERLVLLRELLSDEGSIYLHLDNKMAFTMKLIMDEIFGEDNCRAFITRKKCSTKNYTKNTYGNISDYIMFYTKSSNYTWNRPFEPWDFDKMVEEYPYIDENSGKRYKKVPIHAPGIRNGETGKSWRGKMPPAGKHWQYTPEKLDAFDAAGEIYWSPTGNPRRKIFCDENKGIPIQDIWLNYRDSINQSQKTTGYPTEKNYEMLKMIVSASSNVGDIVLDCFAGSGTTLGAAFECERIWIGVDNSIESVKAILKRFTIGLDIYGDYVNERKEYEQLSLELDSKCSFSIYSTNDKKTDIEEVFKCIKIDTA